MIAKFPGKCARCGDIRPGDNIVYHYSDSTKGGYLHAVKVYNHVDLCPVRASYVASVGDSFGKAMADAEKIAYDSAVDALPDDLKDLWHEEYEAHEYFDGEYGLALAHLRVWVLNFDDVALPASDPMPEPKIDSYKPLPPLPYTGSRKAARAPIPVGVVISAKFPGKCRTCSEDFAVGDKIRSVTLTGRNKWEHASHDPASAPVEKSADETLIAAVESTLDDPSLASTSGLRVMVPKDQLTALLRLARKGVSA